MPAPVPERVKVSEPPKPSKPKAPPKPKKPRKPKKKTEPREPVRVCRHCSVPLSAMRIRHGSEFCCALCKRAYYGEIRD